VGAFWVGVFCVGSLEQFENPSVLSLVEHCEQRVLSVSSKEAA